jgi:hypothetical protein
MTIDFKAATVALVNYLIEMAGDAPLPMLPHVRTLMEEPSVDWAVFAEMMNFAMDMEVYAATRGAFVSDDVKRRYMGAVFAMRLDNLQELATELGARKYEAERAMVMWGCNAIGADWGTATELLSLIMSVNGDLRSGTGTAQLVLGLVHVNLNNAC